MSAVFWDRNMQQSTNYSMVENITVEGFYICLSHRGD
jgi:hypothetical protein